MNVLITSVGRRAYMVKYFKEVLGKEGKVHVCNSYDKSIAFKYADEKVVLVCQTYVTPCLMKSWSVSFGDFHPSGRIGKQL